MKKLTTFITILSLSLLLCACGASSLTGTYTSESGRYDIEFEKDGMCTWYQDGMFFEGSYEKLENGWQLNISGEGLYSNTTFYAEESGSDLIITGGIVEGELFYKQ